MTNLSMWVVRFDSIGHEVVAPRWISKNKDRADIEIICEIIPVVKGNEITTRTLWETRER